MIKEDYVSFETAKLLKENGFNWPCEKSYYLISEVIMASTDDIINPDTWYCPTLQMVMKWLRIEKKLYIQVMLDSWALGDHSGYYIVIQRTDSDFEECSPNVDENDTIFFDTPEEASEAAIKYCLENLI